PVIDGVGRGAGGEGPGEAPGPCWAGEAVAGAAWALEAGTETTDKVIGSRTRGKETPKGLLFIRANLPHAVSSFWLKAAPGYKALSIVVRQFWIEVLQILRQCFPQHPSEKLIRFAVDLAVCRFPDEFIVELSGKTDGQFPKAGLHTPDLDFRQHFH